VGCDQKASEMATGKEDILENVPERMEKVEQLIQVGRKKEKLEGWTKLTLVSRLRNRNLPHQKLVQAAFLGLHPAEAQRPSSTELNRL
jgi:hypothetical protein